MSIESSNFPIEWSPSPALCVALRSLGVLAALSLWLSALPLLAKLVVGSCAIVYGFWLARREARRDRFTLTLAADGETALLRFSDLSIALSKPAVRVRGPLAYVTGQRANGRAIRLLWWPDTLAPGARRALRLASGRRVSESDPSFATMSG